MLGIKIDVDMLVPELIFNWSGFV